MGKFLLFLAMAVLAVAAWIYFDEPATMRSSLVEAHSSGTNAVNHWLEQAREHNLAGMQAVCLPAAQEHTAGIYQQLLELEQEKGSPCTKYQVSSMGGNQFLIDLIAREGFVLQRLVLRASEDQGKWWVDTVRNA